MKKVILLLAIILLFPNGSFAAMSSDNYKIDADVMGVGGDVGTSESFRLTDTIGEPIIGVGASETYKSKAGFWEMVNTSVTLTVDSNTVNLGSITPGSPVEGDSEITVTTDSWGGYDLLTSENHNMTHTDTVTTIPDYSISCDIDNPCAWTGVGLGFTVKSGTSVEAKWGSSPNYNFAYFPESADAFHSKSGYTSGGDQTVVGYKVDTSASQQSGQYSNIITFTAMTKL